MPHIKSIRLTNVYFNNATQFYDDFIMKLEGKNATYDLENGGGKSLLLLMVLQTVLPKCWLRKEKPVSMIFQGGKDRTSHSVVEWILDEGSTYKYMMTGFCSRKRRSQGDPTVRESAARDASAREAAPRDAATREAEEDEALKAGDIEHLNWCVFYNDTRITGIRSLPLVSENGGRKTYASFDDIRKYLQQMIQKELPAFYTDRIDEYHNFIAAHNLIPAEWNIIRGINSGENSIESYFRQNTNSRKLIENLFVKIIEDVESLNKGGKNDDESLLLADTLIELRERLNEYLKLKGHMNEYEKIRDYYGEFSRRNEELGVVYSRYDENRRRAAGIRKRINSRIRDLEKAREGARKRLEFNIDGAAEGNEMIRLLEAGLVDYRRRILEEKRLGLEEQRDHLAGVVDESNKRLNFLNAMEAYGEYRSDRQRQAQITISIEKLQSGGDTQQEEYREAGGKYRYGTEQQIRENEELLKAAESGRTALEVDYKKLLEQRISSEKRESVLDNYCSELESKVSALSGRINALQAAFMKDGEMDAVLASEQFLEKIRAEEEQFALESILVDKKLQELEAEKRTAEITGVQLVGNIQKNRELQLPLKSWLGEYERKRDSLVKSAETYGVQTVQEYVDELGLALHKENLAKLENEIEIVRLRQKKQLSEDKGYYVPNEEILSLEELLRTRCDYVRTGIDWIAAQEPEKRSHLVRSMPFLSFSVIIDEPSFEKLRRNRWKLEFSSDYPVPVVNLEMLRNLLCEAGQDEDGQALQDNNIFYLCSFTELLTDEERFLHYIRNVEALIENLQEEADAAGSRIMELAAFQTEAAAFLAQYSKELVKQQRSALQELEQTAEILKQSENQQKEDSRRMAGEEASLKKRSTELSNNINLSKEKQNRLDAYIGNSKALAEQRDLLTGKRAELETAKKEILVHKDAIDKNYQMQRIASEEINAFQKKQYEFTARMERLNGFRPIENDLPVFRLAASFEALEAAVTGRMAEESSLRETLREIEERLESQKAKTLRNYGEDLERIEENEAAGRPVIIPGREAITASMKEQKENQKKWADASQNVTEIQLKEQAETGRLEEILRGMPEEALTRMPKYGEEEQYKRELENYRQLVQSYEEAVSALNMEINGVEKEIDKYTRQSDEFGSFLEREKIPEDIYENEPEAGLQIEEFKAFSRNYYSLQDEIGALFSKWEDRMKSIQAEAAGFIIREPIIELGRIYHPESGLQCRTRADAFREYLLNIEEQMRKIAHDIEQLENYQQNFIKRCVQRSELVLGHLNKLEVLSRIEIYGGRRINMIDLKLVEFEQNEKLLRMQNHINGIVREIGEEGMADRKRIAAMLSTKELLAQIIDMDKAVVRLYKVESIPENSRYYRWENAIGSEGQNNSLYFIFAACLISFIRMLSISNTSAHTKKVIIADNPFGATSAVYLWDPMFRIMKQNNIQLIAPGHSIPREITSRFGVSYLLNQDILQDGRMRVVVKDVRAEEDEEVIRWIDPEQISMF